MSDELVEEALGQPRLRTAIRELPAGGGLSDEVVDELSAGARTEEEIVGPGGVLAQLTKRLIERAMEVELTDHLGFEPHQEPPGGAGNARNGSTPKTLGDREESRILAAEPPPYRVYSYRALGGRESKILPIRVDRAETPAAHELRSDCRKRLSSQIGVHQPPPIPPGSH